MFKIKFWRNKKEKDYIKQTVEKVAIGCSNCGKETMIDVDLLETNEDLKYDMYILNSDWLTGGPWYNTSTCKKLHGKQFEGFIINKITDRYNIMCSVDAYEREHQSSICDDGRSGGGCPLPKKPTTTALESLGATIDFIGCWIEALEHDFLERCHFYTRFMEELF